MTHDTSSEFARATAVDEMVIYSFTADLDAGWKVAGAVNGGYRSRRRTRPAISPSDNP